MRRIADGDAELAARLRRSFMDEAELAASFDHPAIIPVLDRSETPDGAPYFVMPHLPNSLADRVWPLHLDYFLKTPASDRRIQPVDPNETISILQGLLSALSTVHAAGVAHRDIKPNNVLIDELGHPVLCDFGAALLASGDSVTPRTRIGAPPFVSPEQLADPRTAQSQADVFSVGVMTYLMLTGSPPGESPSRPDQHVAGVSPQVSRLVMHMIEPSPAQRPKDASVVLNLLKSVSPNA